jgi:hypothetical protein
MSEFTDFRSTVELRLDSLELKSSEYSSALEATEEQFHNELNHLIQENKIYHERTRKLLAEHTELLRRLDSSMGREHDKVNLHELRISKIEQSVQRVVDDHEARLAKRADTLEAKKKGKPRRDKGKRAKADESDDSEEGDDDDDKMTPEVVQAQIEWIQKTKAMIEQDHSLRARSGTAAKDGIVEVTFELHAEFGQRASRILHYLERSINRAESSQLNKERDIAAYKAKLGVLAKERAAAVLEHEERLASERREESALADRAQQLAADSAERLKLQEALAQTNSAIALRTSEHVSRMSDLDREVVELEKELENRQKSEENRTLDSDLMRTWIEEVKRLSLAVSRIPPKPQAADAATRQTSKDVPSPAKPSVSTPRALTPLRATTPTTAARAEAAAEAVPVSPAAKSRAGAQRSTPQLPPPEAVETKPAAEDSQTGALLRCAHAAGGAIHGTQSLRCLLVQTRCSTVRLPLPRRPE